MRLSGIEVPPLPLPERPDPAAGGGEASRQELAAKLAGSEIVLRQAEGQPTDRYGRLVGYGFSTAPAGKFSCNRSFWRPGLPASPSGPAAAPVPQSY